ncbi:MAG TPA: hypothetical protein VF192_06105 [Longimicrobiales bacterium]
MVASQNRAWRQDPPPAASRRRPQGWMLTAALMACALALAAASPAAAQGLSPEEQRRARRILEQTQELLEKHYYDTTFHGLDLDALREEVAEAAVAAQNEYHMMALLSRYLLELDDSHTAFHPPEYVSKVDYGFSLQFVGDTCFTWGWTRRAMRRKRGSAWETRCWRWTG